MAVAISKHQRWTPDGEWIPGKLIVRTNSSLRKLMRAVRRGKMPEERTVIIEMAIEKAARRSALYLNSSPAKSAAKGAV